MNEIKRVIDDGDEEYVESKVLEIFNKIKKMPFGKKTTIAILENYDPNEEFVSPIMQGKIFYLVEEMCKKNNINLKRIYDGTHGGLAYYDKFKKIHKMESALLSLFEKLVSHGEK